MILSLIINFNKVIEYQVNDNDFNYYESPSQVFFLCDKLFDCGTLRILFIVILIFNNFICLSVNVFIDVLLFISLKKNEKKSIFLKSKIHVIATYTSPSTSPSDNLQRKTTKFSEEKVKKNRNLTVLIILNGILFVIFRLPEIIFYIFYMNTSFVDLFCMNFFNCAKYFEIIDICNLLDYLIQFFILRKFNNNFKVGVQIFFSKYFKNK